MDYTAEQAKLTAKLAEAAQAASGETVLVDERAPEIQYCIFRAGRERFCLPVLDVEEVVEWPIV
jgi:chemotaxis signal transduction protein